MTMALYDASVAKVLARGEEYAASGKLDLEYILTVTLPAIEQGLAKSGRARDSFKIVGSPFFVTGDAEEEFDAAIKAAGKR